MQDATTQFVKVSSKENSQHSTLFNVSLRGWIALLIIVTICAMSMLGMKVEEPLYTLCGMVVAFYYGQQKPPEPAKPLTSVTPTTNITTSTTT